MKILHLLASPVFSGPAEAVLGLARAQRALGHDVSVAIDRKRAHVTSEEPAAPRFEAEGLLDGSGLELSVKSTPVAVLRDMRRLHRTKADVLHAHFTHDHWLARLGHPRSAVLIRSVHAPRSIRRSLPAADGYTVPFAGLVEALAPRKVVTLPPLLGPGFVAGDCGEARRALGLASGPLVGMVSTFQASRRHRIALEAFVSVRDSRPDARLVLVGDGVLEPELRARVKELVLEGCVDFLGYRTGVELVQCLRAFDEVWVLGLGNDWSGRTAAQARACGARVVTTDEGGLPDFADQVVSDPSPRALAAAAFSGQHRDVRLPSPEDVARRVLSLYEDASARAGGGA